MDITAIIPNYNGRDYLKTCLESVRMQNHLKEVIIVDNGSTDGSGDYIKEKYPDQEVELQYGGQPHYQFILSIE